MAIGIVIDFEGLIQVMMKLQYICNDVDRNELRVWLFNNNLFANPPKFFNKDLIFIDVENALSQLRQEVLTLYKR